MFWCSISLFSLPRMSLSNIFEKVGRRLIGLWFSGFVRSLPDFGIVITTAAFHEFGK